MAKEELEFAECKLFDELEEIRQEMKEGKGIKIDLDALAKELDI